MIGGAPITQVTSTKSLGVHIDQTLSWNVHVENLCKKIASGIGALKRVRPFVPKAIYLEEVRLYALALLYLSHTSLHMESPRAPF